ncbi:hypothetical protein [Amycolatopsis samaneae]|uniref:Uncharacterized protein n=1 Tax=Amycolatopsis samaneae TaxID=664691 RepID=A0ABW5GCV2_9PSEU
MINLADALGVLAGLAGAVGAAGVVLAGERGGPGMVQPDTTAARAITGTAFRAADENPTVSPPGGVFLFP